MSMEQRKVLRNSIFLPTLMYGSETWTWNKIHYSRVHAVEMSYLSCMWRDKIGG